MSTVLRLAKKEWQHALNSYFAYFVIGAFVIALPIPLFWSASPTNVFLSGVADLRPLFSALPLFMMIFVPALSMRAWTNERQSGTMELLGSLGIPKYQLVLGKFLGNYSFLLFALLATLPLPYLVSGMGSLDWAVVMSAYGGALLLSAACLAICLFLGSLVKDPISAFVLGISCLGAGMFLPVQSLNLHDRFARLAGGLIQLQDLLFYGIVAGLFILLNVRVLQMRQRFY